MSVYRSTLYIVPTPIGNLQDITYRALTTLRQVDFLVVENTRRARVLLNFFTIHKSLFVLHKFNEYKQTPILIEKLQSGLSVALVSDSGTPLISDPGYYLVHTCRQLNIRVIPLPGPCAAITALCGSGLPTDRFCFEGFIPSKHRARVSFFKNLLEESRTLIFYDVKHRIIDTVRDMKNVFGKERYVVLGKELTKVWESIYGAPLGQLLSWIQEDNMRIQGEMVLILSGYNIKKKELSPKIFDLMNFLTLELSLKKSAGLVAYIYGVSKNKIYKAYLNKRLEDHLV